MHSIEFSSPPIPEKEIASANSTQRRAPLKFGTFAAIMGGETSRMRIQQLVNAEFDKNQAKKYAPAAKQSEIVSESTTTTTSDHIHHHQ